MTNDPQEQLRPEFNEWARAGKGESMEKVHRPVGQQAIERMCIPTDARVMDVGCGSGWASRLWAGSAIRGRVTGIDISDEMIRVARDSSQLFPNVDFEIAGAEQLPFNDNEFTHAFSMELHRQLFQEPGRLRSIQTGRIVNDKRRALMWKAHRAREIIGSPSTCGSLCWERGRPRPH